MRTFQLISGISLQAQQQVEKNIVLLDRAILIPVICGIMILVMIAGIAVAVQKHKRY